MEQMNADLNLVLLGKTGAGKSSTGNTILGQQAFITKKRFISVTPNFAVESVSVCGFPVTVYDTPGFFDPELIEQELLQKYQSIFQKCESAPSAFLLVIKADRFTIEERKTVETIEKLLGQKHLEKTWILFTRGDELEEENMTIQEFINDTEPLKKLIQKYDQRYHVFNNKTKGQNGQVKMLLAKILQTNFRINLSDGQKMLRQIPVIRTNAQDEQHTSVSSLSSRRIVLLGNSGVGKSAAGNTILGQKKFRSAMRMGSVTSECSDAHATVSGRSVSVVDTPGFFDTLIKPKESMMEIAKSVYLSSPGPHAFLIVFPVNMRITEHEQLILQMIEEMFGEEVLKYSIILFTHGDLLEEPINELIKENYRLRYLVDQCGGRFHIFNNRDENNRKQVNDLLQKIDTTVEQNRGRHYSNEMFEDAQRFRQEEKKRTEREEEERKQQMEKHIQEENERVRKETEKRIRAEIEAENKSLETERQSKEKGRKQHQEIERLTKAYSENDKCTVF